MKGLAKTLNRCMFAKYLVFSAQDVSWKLFKKKKTLTIDRIAVMHCWCFRIVWYIYIHWGLTCFDVATPHLLFPEFLGTSETHFSTHRFASLHWEPRLHSGVKNTFLWGNDDKFVNVLYHYIWVYHWAEGWTHSDINYYAYRPASASLTLIDINRILHSSNIFDVCCNLFLSLFFFLSACSNLTKCIQSNVYLCH